MKEQTCGNCHYWAFSQKDVGRCLKVGTVKHPKTGKPITVLSKKGYVCKWWKQE